MNIKSLINDNMQEEVTIFSFVPLVMVEKDAIKIYIKASVGILKNLELHTITSLFLDQRCLVFYVSVCFILYKEFYLQTWLSG